MLEAFKNIFRIPELRRRILFTLGMIAVYRVGSFIPIPGINVRAVSEYSERVSTGVFGLLNLFTGGAFGRISIFALGIMPYITTSIIMQLLTTVIPQLEQLAKEGEVGRKKINQYTRYGTVLVCLIQGFGMTFYVTAHPQFLTIHGFMFRMLALLSWVTGTIFLMWCGEQITDKGIGNGISLLIFASIVERIPALFINLIRGVAIGEKSVPLVMIFLAVLLAVIAGVVFIETGHRKIPIQYAQRIIGRRIYGGQSTYLPIKVDVSGVIAIIFAQSVLQFPLMILHPLKKSPIFGVLADWLGYHHPIHNILYFGLIIFFCYFYTAIVFNPNDIAENVKKYGGFIPGIRPGKATSEFIEYTVTRLTFIGAIAVGIIAIIPNFLFRDTMGIEFAFGGTSIIIVVGVALDTVKQIESHLLMRHYEGFMKHGKLKARRVF
jgi:preprotein translocase subunit SecY